VYKHHQTEGKLRLEMSADMLETVYFNKMAEATGIVSDPSSASLKLMKQDLWGKNAMDHHTFDQNLEAAMVYVRYCRQNLEPTPAPSPVSEPVEDLVDAYDKFPNLDADQPFNPKVFRTHLDQVFTEFGQHMVDEIETLSKANVEKIGEKNLNKINEGLQKALMAHGPEWFLCSMCCELSLRPGVGLMCSSWVPERDSSTADWFTLDREMGFASCKFLLYHTD